MRSTGITPFMSMTPTAHRRDITYIHIVKPVKLMWITLLIQLVMTLVNVVLNWWAIPRYGYLAAGWTTLASYLLLTLLHYVLMRRRCREQGVEEKIFPVGKMLLISLLVLAATFGMMALYSMGWVRYAVVLVEGALAWLFRKKIFAMIGRKEN